MGLRNQDFSFFWKSMIFLVDNGSIRPLAYENLVSIAGDLSYRIGEVVWPAPLLHADKIYSQSSQGPSPVLLEERIIRAMGEGDSEFEIIPLFFGPSGAITDYLPRRLEKVGKAGGPLSVRILNNLFLNDHDGGDLLTDILEERVFEIVRNHQLSTRTVVMVDHGSPKKEVTAVRDKLSGLLADRLEGWVVRPASMERREGSEYDFNEPLLEMALNEVEEDEVIVAPLFLSPGRHAGPGGDIEKICQEAEAWRPGLSVHRTDLVGNHPKLIDLLARRWDQRDQLRFKRF